MPVCIEDECNPDLPPASLLFRSARQYAYGVLFSLAETQRRLERMAMRKRTPLEGEYGTESVMSEAYNQYSDTVTLYIVQCKSFRHMRRNLGSCFQK